MTRLRCTIATLLSAIAIAAVAQDEAARKKFAELERQIKAAEQARLEACRELYRFIQQGIAAAAETPAMEAANYLRTDGTRKAVEGLKQGKMPGAWHMNVIRENTIFGYDGKNWPRPPDVKVPYATQPITIDGKLDDPAWRRAATFNDSYPFNQKEKSDDAPTVYRIAWDQKYLYFAFECTDRDIIAEPLERDGNVYFHDCVEMFILPEWRLRTYWELVIGPQGAIFDAIQAKDYEHWGFNSRPAENVKGLKVGIRLDGTLNRSNDKDKGYVVEIAVPFDQLPGYAKAKAEPGQTLHCMLARLDKNTTAEKDDKGQPKTTVKAYAFTPLLSWGHNIWNHAKLTLEK